ncbi:MAG: hypothetical protein M3Z66_25400, partial [Chloroflexota bacterium]|nr:hypothetical protein [Chloroflexota bacterium]
SVGMTALVPVLCLFVLFAGLVDSWRWGFTPLARGYIVPSAGKHQQLEVATLRSIPVRAVVAAADEIEPHLSDRRWIYLLPTIHPRNGPAARYLAIDATVPAEPVEPHTLRVVFDRALRQGYGIDRAVDGVIVLRAGAPRHSLPTGFYSWLYQPGDRVTVRPVHWGSLTLTGFVVYPRNGQVNRARPAVGVDTFWRTSSRLSSRVCITLYLSPVYHGRHPAFSSRWQRETDSPTWDWLPLVRWPIRRTIHAALLPLVPAGGDSGKVDVAVGVSGSGKSTGRLPTVAGGGNIVRLGTISVEGAIQ